MSASLMMTMILMIIMMVMPIVITFTTNIMHVEKIHFTYYNAN